MNLNLRIADRCWIILNFCLFFIWLETFSPARAENIREAIPQSVDEINRSMRETGTTSGDCSSGYCGYTASPVTGSDIAACVNEICGSKPVSTEQALIEGLDPINKLDPNYEEKIRSTGEKLNHAEANLWKQSLTTAAEFLSSSNPELNQNEIQSIIKLYAFRYLDVLVIQDGPKVDRSESAPLLERFPEAVRASIMDSADKLLQALAEARTHHKIVPSDPAQLRAFFTASAWSEKVKLHREQATPRLESLQKDPFTKVLFEDYEIEKRRRESAFRRLKDINTASPVDINRHINDFSTIVMHDFFLTSKYNVSGLPEKAKLKDVLPSDASEMIESQIAEHEAIITYTQQDLPSCAAAFGLSKKSKPTPNQIQQVKKLIDQSKKEFEKNIEGLFSEHSVQLLKKQIKDWRFSFPITHDQYTNQLSQDLKLELTDAERRIKMAASGRNIKSPAERAYLTAAHASATTARVMSSAAEDICAAQNPVVLPDFALKEGNSIYVGPLVAKHPEELRAILHHEMAHLLSGNISKAIENKSFSESSRQRYQQVVKCLEAQSGVPKLYVEEDFADLLSGYAKSAPNVACVLVKRKNVSDYEQMSFVNPISKDTHSSPLFRLLHVETARSGRLPATCDSVRTKMIPTRQFRNCFE